MGSRRVVPSQWSTHPPLVSVAAQRAAWRGRGRRLLCRFKSRRKSGPPHPVADGAVAAAKGGARALVLERFGRHVRLERVELPGRGETLLVLRGFAAHASPERALAFAKQCYWGHDATAEDMRWLTQWEHVAWRALDALLLPCCAAFGRRLRRDVRDAGFGQLRWYGATTETAVHSDGFDGRCAGDGRTVCGRSRCLLRLGGDGFLTLRWLRRGGPVGGISVLLRHGDLVLMDRSIAGTRRDGRAREFGLRVTHRAGGLLAPHAPAALQGGGCEPRSFCTLVWTTSVSRERFLRFLRLRVLPPPASASRRHLASSRRRLRSWPEDPDSLLDEMEHDELLPWEPDLTLFDRQRPRARKRKRKR